MSLAAALATASHHSAQPYAAPRGQTTGTNAGLRAPERPLPEVLPQVGLQRHTVEQRIVHTPYVQILDAPVPQMVEQLLDFFKDLDVDVPAQVIEVPKISQDIIPQRSLDLVPQMAEQSVEVPTVLIPTRIALRIAEQIVSSPVPRGRVQGFLPVQSSTTFSSYGKRISERTVVQIVDISSSGGGFGHGASSSAGPADEDFTGVFRTWSAGQVSADLPRHVSSWTPAACGQPRSSSTVLTWRIRSRSHSAVLRSCTRLLTCPLICVYRCLTWSRQCRKSGVRRCSSWTTLPCPLCARQRS